MMIAGYVFRLVMRPLQLCEIQENIMWN